MLVHTCNAASELGVQQGFELRDKNIELGARARRDGRSGATVPELHK